jgi:ribonucleoside-diphosphate reductase alpha chain
MFAQSPGAARSARRRADRRTRGAARRALAIAQPPQGYTQKATVGGHKVYLRTGEHEDGRLAEVFS